MQIILSHILNYYIMVDLTNNFDGIDTNAYDDVCIIHQNQVICVKGNKPENCSFSSVPVSFVLAVRYNSGKPYYSVFQMQYDKFIFIGGGERITSTDDGAIFLCDTKTLENGEEESHIYQLVLNEEGFYYKVELFKV